MRIAVSNPDNLGDVLLREPLFGALHEAGHELLLIVRDFVAPLARDIAPYAEIAVCPGNPYIANFHFNSPLGGEFKERVRKFAPELLVLGAYHFTDMDQQIAAFLPGVETVGLSGSLFQPQPNLTIPTTLQLTTRVAVSLETPEPVKNELLCSAILSRSVTLRPPRLEPTSAGKSLAATHLAKLGLKNSPFWAVCAGDRPPWAVKNWEKERWIQLCRTLIEDHGVRILFVGSEAEHEETSAIQAGLGRAARRTASITGSAIPVSELVALLAAAEGYIGKDTGPMHIAAALGKPVVAVFGGGHWPRFVPLAKSGAVFSVDMPCKGCDWICRLERSHCVKDIPLAPVLAAAVAAVEGRAETFRVELLPRDGLLDAELFQEMYSSAQAAYRLLETERANFMQWHGDRVRDIEQLQAQLAEERAQVAILAQAKAECDGLHEQVRSLESARAELERDRQELSQERGALAMQMSDAQVRIIDLESRLSVLQGAAQSDQQARMDLAAQLTESLSRIGSLESQLAAAVNAVQSHQEEQQRLLSKVEEAHQQGRAQAESAAAVVIKEREIALEGATRRLQTLETELAVQSIHSREYREDARRLGMRVEALEREEKQLRDEIALSAESARTQAQKVAERLEPSLLEKSLLITELQAHIDTVESRHTGRIADLEKALQQERRQGQLALALVPELRDELTNEQRDLADLRNALQQFRHTAGIHNGEPKGILGEATTRLLSAEGQIADFSERLRVAAGWQARPKGWLENWELVESDRAARLEMVHQLSNQIREAEEMANSRVAALAGELDEVAGRLRSALGDGASDSGWRENLALLEQDREDRLGQILAWSDHIKAAEAEASERIQALREEIAEFSSLVRLGAGNNSAFNSWREDLDVIEKDRHQRLLIIEALSQNIRELEDDRRQRLDIIETLSQNIRELEDDRRQRLDIIETLSQNIRELEDDRRQRLDIIETLSQNIRELEDDRRQRLDIIEVLSRNIRELEDDRQQRLAIIEELSETNRKIEADRAQRGAQIETLHRHIEGLVRDKQALERTVALRLMRTLGLMKA